MEILKKRIKIVGLNVDKFMEKYFHLLDNKKFVTEIIKFYESFRFFAIERSNRDSIKMIRPFYD